MSFRSAPEQHENIDQCADGEQASVPNARQAKRGVMYEDFSQKFVNGRTDVKLDHAHVLLGRKRVGPHGAVVDAKRLITFASTCEVPGLRIASYSKVFSLSGFQAGQYPLDPPCMELGRQTTAAMLSTAFDVTRPYSQHLPVRYACFQASNSDFS